MVWNERTGNLVSGHQRLDQLDLLEETEDYTLEIDVVDISESQEKELNILLNAKAVQGEDDPEQLAKVLMELTMEGRDVRDAGMTVEEAAELFSSFDMVEKTVAAPEDPDVLFAPDVDELAGKSEKKEDATEKVTFSFETKNQAARFLSAIGLDTKRSVFDWEDISEALDLG